MNWLLLHAFCVSVVWAPLRLVLLDDLLPARARVGTRMIIFRCQLLGCRSLARWPGWVASLFSCYLVPACLCVGLAKRLPVLLFCRLLSSCVVAHASRPGPGGCACNHLMSLVRLARLNYLFSSSVLVVSCRRYPRWLGRFPDVLLDLLRSVQLPFGAFARTASHFIDLGTLHIRWALLGASVC